MSSKHRDLVRRQLEKHLNLLNRRIKPIIEPPTTADILNPDTDVGSSRCVDHNGGCVEPQGENGRTQTAPFDDVAAVDADSPCSPAKYTASVHDLENSDDRDGTVVVNDVLGQLARGISSFGLTESSVSTHLPKGWGWSDDDDEGQSEDEPNSTGQDGQSRDNDEPAATEQVPQPLESGIAKMDGANDLVDCPLAHSQFTATVPTPNNFPLIDPPNGVEAGLFPPSQPSPTHRHQDPTPPNHHIPIPSHNHMHPAITVTLTDIQNFHLHHKAIKRMLDGLDKNAQAADEANEAKRLARYLKFDDMDMATTKSAPWPSFDSSGAGRPRSKLRHGCTPADLEWEEWAARVAWMQFMGVGYRRDEEGRRVHRL
ncbi:hypothetical protein B0T22DRAFT_442495 [Podospora appendiculata]|uniref:Uncharacterized protein n=1 Tax=Podospora appendiculata TaxID=314037 RepID=A0AAE0X5I9_9PEZI|nr:hypothetical protein B0T22DRAFT_442495 [Podospora appendiculata]